MELHIINIICLIVIAVASIGVGCSVVEAYKNARK